MDERNVSLKDALRELAATAEPAAGPHPGWRRLIAYRQGDLAAAQRDALQEHLALCPKCTGRLRELRAFELDLAQEGGHEPAPRQQAAWNALARKLEAGEALPRPFAAARPAGRSWSAWYRAAAALFLAAVLTAGGLALVRQSRSLNHLAHELRERDAALAESRRELAEAQHRLAAVAASPAPERPPAHPPVKRRETPPDPGRVTEVASQIAVVLAPRFTLRGQAPEAEAILSEGDAVHLVRLQAAAESFSVALELSAPPASGEIHVELLDAAGQVRWSGRAPAASVQGDAGTSVTLGGLNPGLYRLRLQAGPEANGAFLGDYRLGVEVAPHPSQ